MRRFTETLTRNLKPDFSLFNLGQIIDDQEALCKDQVVPMFSNARLDCFDGSFKLCYTSDLGVEYRKELSEFAMGQLCLKAGVPAQYVYKCIDKQEPWAAALVLTNINEWLKRSEAQDVLIRLYGDTIRGILSAKYTCFDTPKIFEGLRAGFQDSGYSVKEYLVSPERFHLRMVKDEAIPSLDDLYAGLVVNSSDVGRFAISIEYFVYKKVCSNGLMIRYKMGPRFRQIHLGSVKEIEAAVKTALAGMEDYEAYVTEFIQDADTKDYRDILQDRESQEFENFFNMIKTQTGLSGNAVMEVIDIMETRYSTTTWGLVNAITEKAQSYTLDRRILLERAAGRILVA